MSASEWSRITRIDGRNHRHLDSDDICMFLHTMETHGYDEMDKWSDTYRTIHEFKANPIRSRDSYSYGQRKKRATERIAADLISFFASNDRAPEAKFLLIPAVTSKPEGHPEHDDRLLEVCRAVAEAMDSVTCANILSIDEELPSAHGCAGMRRPADLLPHIAVDATFPIDGHDVLLVFDDVITTGGHYKACKQAIQLAYGDVNAAGIFWARTESWAERDAAKREQHSRSMSN